jgi:hypothetical protein
LIALEVVFSRQKVPVKRIKWTSFYQISLLHIVLALCTIITHFIVTSEETYGFVAIIPPSAY